jgi:hypothetical protein
MGNENAFLGERHIIALNSIRQRIEGGIKLTF